MTTIIIIAMLIGSYAVMQLQDYIDDKNYRDRNISTRTM